MAAPPYHFPPLEHHHHQFLPLPEEQKQSQGNSPAEAFRNLYTIDDELAPPAPFYSATASFPPVQAHPPCIPPFHVVGFAPAPVSMLGGDEDGRVIGDFQWNCHPEQNRSRLKEQDFLENNSHVSSVDFLQARSVSTGLGLSLDDTNRESSFGDSYISTILGDEINQELQRHDAELDRYLKLQGERLRKVILHKIQADQLQTLSYAEEKVLQRLREKEVEVENINQKNLELEEKIERLATEVGVWQERTKYSENMINLLKFNLQQVHAQSKDSKEGCGDSEVDDTASCCNGRTIAFRSFSKDNSDMKELMTCKVCGSSEVCMLLLPCKHLCLCKDCESRFTVCPLCKCSKMFAVEVNM